ncbi:Acetoacetate decarboxylase [Fontibacillus panacisegetis]|uniref:Acetoacetate decarboxylase n=1 Tax=Fontibacillus panacisegetis TaxID=670482 RepID=A0A1G7PYB5_9BACL|nr:acetoacetate decarboxylase family protein [Fontibacillus panacisegetis]SDF91213.1 Acetoacetate decarboxylase [Fontibacillus panacisegetis]
MLVKGTTVQGYSLPLSDTGKSSLVEKPPWYFGGDGIEVIYRTNIESFRKFVPYPLEVSELNGVVSITMVDMTSVSSEDMAYLHPEKTQYKECLIKFHCKYKGKQGWYVPLTWVDKDFSLLRGFLLGFGKKMGQINITKLHNLNSLIGSQRKGTMMKAVCESFNGIHVEINLELLEQTEKDEYAGNSMFVMRHYPDIHDANEVSVHELIELVVDQAVKTDIWKANGDVRIESFSDEEISVLQPKEILAARTFSEGFVLHGGKVLYRFNESEL